jgi:predicted permease
VTQVSSTFFGTLGVSLSLGGGFGPRTGDVDRIVLSHDLWRSDFGADPDILGTQVYLTERPLTVVGVAPPDVDFPGGTQAWLPMPTWGDLYGTASGSEVLARVRSPADMEPLRARLQARVNADWADVPERIPPVAEVRPMRAVLAGGLVTPLALLGGGAALVLILACLNLAGIELAGMSQRTRELRVRRALGASRARMVAQLLTESLALAVLAGAGGIALAAIAIPLLEGLLPAGAHGVDAAGLDPVILGFATLLTVVTGLAVGVLPAMRASRRGGLGPGGGASESLEGRRLQLTLVVLQIAVAVVLAGGAGLLGRSMAARLDTDLGYDVEQVFTFRVRVPAARADDRPAYLRAVRERLAALPGVVAVGASTALPLSEGAIAGWQIQRAGREEPRVGASRVEATDGFLNAMGIPILEGTDLPAPFASEDGVVVTRSVVDTLFGAEPALGQLVQLGGARGMGDPQPIVGIIDDLRLYGEEVGGRAAVLAPYRHQIGFGFAVRTTGDPSALAPAVRGILEEVDPGIPPFEMRTTASALAQHRAARSAVARLTGLFGSVALILASFGLYGLIARNILTRRRELGVRIALGASPRALVRRTVVSGMGLAVLGIGLGIAAFLPLASRLDSMLFQVDPREPSVLGPVVLVVLAVTVLATWIPARATLRLEPRDALRAEP